jgi:hypothetical protein
VLRGINLTYDCMRAAGFERPRIAIAGLNPHAGEGGNFGREEIDAIGPAVESARAKGVAVEGHFPRRHRLPSRQERRVRCRADHVSRPGPDRNEAHGLRSRRDAARRFCVSDLHPGARHRLGDRGQGCRRHWGDPRSGAAHGGDGERERIANPSTSVSPWARDTYPPRPFVVATPQVYVGPAQTAPTPAHHARPPPTG